MGRIHEVLRWANRRDVAREVTRRGYRVSGETLNRWVREEAEFPAVVERIVYDLFTITPDTTTEPPPWAEALADRTALKVIGALADPEVLAALPEAIAALEALPRPQLDSPRGGELRQDQAGSKR